MTKLMQIVQKGLVTELEALLTSGVDLNTIDDNGHTALMHAIMGKDPVMTTMLIEAGADLNIANKNGHTALSIALSSNFFSAIVDLVNHGVRCQTELPSKGKTELALAVIADSDIRDLYVKHFLRENKDHLSAEIINFLETLANTTDVEKHSFLEGLNLEISYGITPFYQLVKSQPENLYFLKSLLQLGVVDINHTTVFNANYLHKAVKEEAYQAIHTLVDLGVRTDCKNDADLTPLYVYLSLRSNNGSSLCARIPSDWGIFKKLLSNQEFSYKDFSYKNYGFNTPPMYRLSHYKPISKFIFSDKDDMKIFKFFVNFGVYGPVKTIDAELYEINFSSDEELSAEQAATISEKIELKRFVKAAHNADLVYEAIINKQPIEPFADLEINDTRLEESLKGYIYEYIIESTPWRDIVNNHRLYIVEHWFQEIFTEALLNNPKYHAIITNVLKCDVREYIKSANTDSLTRYQLDRDAKIKLVTAHKIDPKVLEEFKQEYLNPPYLKFKWMNYYQKMDYETRLHNIKTLGVAVCFAKEKNILDEHDVVIAEKLLTKQTKMYLACESMLKIYGEEAMLEIKNALETEYKVTINTSAFDIEDSSVSHVVPSLQYAAATALLFHEDYDSSKVSGDVQDYLDLIGS